MAVDQQLVERLRAWSRADDTPRAGGVLTASARLPLPLFYAGQERDAERPGAFPYTRGASARGYHDDLWVMGMYSGYASPKETNARFKKLLNAGQTGLSIALDLPTQIGSDSDHPEAISEVGKVGVPLNTVEDMLTLLDGLPIQNIRQMRTSANAIGPIFAAFVVVALEEMGIDPRSFRLFLQNDPLKEFSARGTWIFPPEASLRFAVDVVEYFSEHHPNWEPIQFCGYHIRDAGGTAVQEVAVSAANGIAYLDEAVRRGVDVAKVAPSLFLFLSSGVDIFEEAAKFRAARRLWARLLTERYRVPAERAGLRIFAYTLGGALTAQEPENNIVRIAYEALAAALGGVQTLATSSWDEAHSLPSAEAAHLALRTQQILGYEAGVAKVVDPLGGSYYVEDMTHRLEAKIAAYLMRIVERGGAIEGISSRFIVEELAEAAYTYQKEILSGARPLVGVNFKPRPMAEATAGAFTLPPSISREAIEALNAVRAKRDPHRARAALAQVERAAREQRNTIPALIEATRARASLGEMTDALAQVFGRYSSGVEFGEIQPIRSA